jgi:hypothetical protein
MLEPLQFENSDALLIQFTAVALKPESVRAAVRLVARRRWPSFGGLLIFSGPTVSVFRCRAVLTDVL